MGKGLLAKAGRIQLPPARPAQPSTPEPVAAAAPAATAVPVADPAMAVPAPAAVAAPAPARLMGVGALSKPRTAPGTLMGFMATQSEAIKENEELREQLSQFEGARPARLLDPRLIRPSRWANRHASAFEREEFAALKAEIAQAGGNVQAIKVRPITAAQNAEGQGVGPSHSLQIGDAGQGVGRSHPLDGAQGVQVGQGGRTVPPPPAPQFEITFGHRRHRACLELGLPVLAIVEDVSEQELFVQMERENRNRTDLSVWEQGVMYAKALDGGLYSSNRQLAIAIGRDLSDVGKALAVARLPLAVIEAFASPLDLQFRWAKPLSDAQQKDPDLLLSRAKSLKDEKLSPKEIFAALISDPATAPALAKTTTVERNGVVTATISTSTSGQISIKVHQPMDEARLGKLVKALEQLL
ncbi:MAG: ParB/RepB/Spo0J family partition protein [Proteobacteria bacterium]|nr:ParB/RepB/Spo0J family partition protein [Pseudomonadota bacterium]